MRRHLDLLVSTETQADKALMRSATLEPGLVSHNLSASVSVKGLILRRSIAARMREREAEREREREMCLCARLFFFVLLLTAFFVNAQ